MMSKELQSCPAAEDLQRFLTSELSESELERIAAHLDGCEACRQRIDASPELAAWGDDVRWATIQREKTPVGRGVDVYALGATLYELLAFRPMFAARDDREVLSHVLNKEPPPHRFVRQVPRELETICLKAVEKDRTSRYANVKAMADDLRRWLLDLPIHAKRPSLMVRAGKFVRRRKLPVALATTCAVLLIATALIYAAYSASHRAAADAKLVATTRHARLMCNEAHEELLAGNFAVALDKANAGLTEDPNAAALLRLRARALRRLVREDEALAVLEQILADHPDDWDAHYITALALSTLSYPGITYYADPARVVRDLPPEERRRRLAYHREQVHRLHPDSAESFVLLAAAETDPHRAIELLIEAFERCPALGEALERDPAYAAWWHNRGLAKCRLGRFAEALADANKAIELDPEFAYGYLGRARAHAGLGRVEHALADYDRALDLAPGDIEIYHERSKMHFDVDHMEESIADMTRVIELAPGDARAYGNRAVAYILMKQYDRAIGDLTRCIELEPDNAKAYRNRGHAHALSEQYVESVADYTKAIELESDVPGDLSSRANLFIHLGQYENAIADLTQLIDLQEVSESIIMQRGMAYELVGASRLALADYDKVSASSGRVGEYAKLWKYILLRESEQDKAAADILASQASAGSNHVWTDVLFDLFMERLSVEDLLAAAVTDDERGEAYYYVARKALLDGRPNSAKDAFAKCVALDRSDVLETAFARARLKQFAERSRPLENAP